MSTDTEETTDIKALCAALIKRGIAGVTVTYSGSGDSGDVDEVTPTLLDCSIKKAVTANENPKEFSETPALTEAEVAAFSEWATDALSSAGIDWYNNEGGFGEVVLNCVTEKALIGHNENVQSTEYSDNRG